MTPEELHDLKTLQTACRAERLAREMPDSAAKVVALMGAARLWKMTSSPLGADIVHTYAEEVAEGLGDLIGEGAQANIDALKHNLGEYARVREELSNRKKEPRPTEVMALVYAEGDIGKAMGGWLRLSAGLLRVIDRLMGVPEPEFDFGEKVDLPEDPA